ncbi:hypothetical protein WJ542_19440 [Paraburkholderia sp. B3]|uniref:hypothetical protein n=1 Tax=Paraburkholderia sp. B3 TaxID=3134791 RepID=UPI0039819F5C
MAGSGSLNNASYQGTGIRIDLLAADGSTVVDSTLRSNLTVVPLSGAMIAAPSELDLKRLPPEATCFPEFQYSGVNAGP